MIGTLKPFGAIKESEIQYLIHHESRGRFYAVDMSANRWQIDETTFLRLERQGLTVRR